MALCRGVIMYKQHRYNLRPPACRLSCTAADASGFGMYIHASFQHRLLHANYRQDGWNIGQAEDNARWYFTKGWPVGRRPRHAGTLPTSAVDKKPGLIFLQAGWLAG